jgi:hypothetical protein
LNWQRLKAALEQNGLQTDGLNLSSYAGIRNLQLLIPHLLGAQVIVALDDDEKILPDYLEKVQAFIGGEFNGEKVLGLAGPYLQPDGSVLLNVPEQTGNLLRDKGYFINQAMQGLMDPQAGLQLSPLALGGNMVFQRACFSRVPFDPGITRGEDIDYLINAHLQGIKWWFDPQLTILHLPPRHYETPVYQRMREDVIRFIYEVEKLRSQGILYAEWLEPYPGALLKDDFSAHALAALEAEKTAENAARFGEPGEIIEQARAHAARHLGCFLPFVQEWTEMMKQIETDESLRDLLAATFRSVKE